MIHQYKNNGYNIVLDVNSGSVHVVDDMVYDIIGLYENNTLEQITDALRDRYSVQDIKEAYEEIGELKEAGQLFTEDIYEPYIDNFKDRPTVVKALCLHIAHDCNLACKYCFAEEGEYHGRRALMSYEVGKKALDFLVANSGSRKNLEVDFFGGEPTMNFEVVKQLVEYGRSIEEANNLNILAKNISIVSQTTFNLKKFKEIVEIFEKKGYDIKCLNTICNATEVRQTEARQIASQVDAMIVIGGKNSSNTQKLFEICKEECSNTYYIQTAEDLDYTAIRGMQRIGITAGASTPKNIIEEVQTRCQI